jgi:hypothetical protein
MQFGLHWFSSIRLLAAVGNRKLTPATSTPAAESHRNALIGMALCLLMEGTTSRAGPNVDYFVVSP